MKLNDLFEIVPETQNMRIIIYDDTIYGTANAMTIYLIDSILESTVDNIEAENDELKVWITTEG